MQILHQNTRRPFLGLAVVIALTTLLTATACGSAAQPEPAAAPTESQAVTGDSGAHQDSHGSATSESQNPDSDHQTETSATPADAVVINLPIAGRATTLTREDLQVNKGATVSITFTADEAGEIHLHGYDLTASVSPDTAGTLEFVADTAGAFGINFHVFGDAGMESADSDSGHHHAPGVPDQVVLETPVSLVITAAADADGGVNIHILVDDFRFAPELVDQAHTSGAGHAHIYLDGEKLGRVFEPDYHIADVPPGEREIRVSLNTNDHSELVFDGKKVEATATVTVPDVGQGRGEDDHNGDSHDHGGHEHNEDGDREAVAEVHLGNLEVYP